MPLPAEHTARQKEPGACKSFRRQNGAFGPGIDVIWCVNPGKATEPQSIHFDAGKFTPEEAKAWLEKHNFSAANFEPASGKGKASALLVNLAAEGLPSGLRLCGASEALELLAEAAGPNGSKLRPFAMTAYTGAAMRVDGFGLPVVVDLAGMKVPGQRLPILRQHNPDRIVGHSEKIEVTAQRLRVSGVISGVGPDAQEVLSLAGNSFPWQASLGADVGQMERVEKGADAKANGRVFAGPVYVARQTTLGEVSFVPMGADGQTAATVA
jgi:hypothetical protein